MNREPVAITAAVEAFVIAVVALLAYLLNWSTDAVALVLGVVSAGVVLAGAVFARSKVTPVA